MTTSIEIGERERRTISVRVLQRMNVHLTGRCPVPPKGTERTWTTTIVHMQEKNQGFVLPRRTVPN